jgi:hypothetical protein
MLVSSIVRLRSEGGDTQRGSIEHCPAGSRLISSSSQSSGSIRGNLWPFAGRFGGSIDIFGQSAINGIMDFRIK